MQTDEEVGKVAQAVPVIIYILWVKIYTRNLVFIVIIYVKVWNCFTKYNKRKFQLIATTYILE
jgi:hypothetical protein